VAAGVILDPVMGFVLPTRRTSPTDTRALARSLILAPSQSLVVSTPSSLPVWRQLVCQPRVTLESNPVRGERRVFDAALHSRETGPGPLGPDCEEV
jgi:hypothetical protein